LDDVVEPYDFTWRDVVVLMGVRDAEGEYPLTSLLYPNPHGHNELGQERFQRFKDTGMLEVKHCEDGPVMVDLTTTGQEFVEKAAGCYSEIQATLSEVVSDHFLDDLKAVHKALSTREAENDD
jgi:hypothetical protein